ncbi:polysaccharide deacetylase family protein [Actinokineospora inagensis]|uniref:polysaccharide deacetylase family protein n=1 Tax=Actinokineospora inagensis TaxID=103730 RepID=UPI001FDF882F|nr:polysaccharide deacetylase family protein [Actinokineospora inagensis]
MRCPAHGFDRRAFLGMLGLGLAVAACSSPEPGKHDGPVAQPASSAPPPSPTGRTDPEPPPPPLQGQQKLSRGPAGTHHIALTVDDGYCDECVAGYVDFADRTGTHLTFSPNGTYAHAWAPHADKLRPLVERGQVQIMNHTFTHADLRKLNDHQIEAELDRNEQWVVSTFGTSTRPYYRPPFGFHNPRIEAAAAQSGYLYTVLWNGSYSDSELITPDFLMEQARKYLTPGTIMLGHANHPTVLGLFDQILALVKDRSLTPVTLDEMFGTHRPTTQ